MCQMLSSHYRRHGWSVSSSMKLRPSGRRWGQSCALTWRQRLLQNLRHACKLQGGRPNGGSGECTTAELQHAKDIGLVMILKNENETIHETLASLRDHIDYWTIVDTGSTGESDQWLASVKSSR